MKKILTLAAALLLTVASFAQSGKAIYNKYSDSEGVSAVYISPAMFRMMGKLPDMELADDEDVNLAPVVRSLKGMYILDIEDRNLALDLKRDVEKFIGSGNYELLMEAKEDGEIVRMYTVGDERTIKGFVFLATEKDETTFICLDGEMDREGFEELVAQGSSQM